MGPASNTPHVPFPHFTAVSQPPPPVGIAAAVSLPATDRETCSSLVITHSAGKLGLCNDVFVNVVYVLNL